jgi:hypothetical protein
VAKLAEVRVGQIWTARVSQRRVRVRVDSIDKPDYYAYKGKKTTLTLTNLTTGRVLSARTPAFLRVKVAEDSSTLNPKR